MAFTVVRLALDKDTLSHFLVYQLAYGLLYYVAYEAFFRGMLQFALRQKLGATAAILIQTCITTLLHIGKPETEIWSASCGIHHPPAL